MKKPQKSAKRSGAAIDRKELAARYIRKAGQYWGKILLIVLFLIFWTWFVGDRTNWWLFDNASPSNADTGTPAAGLEESSDNSGGTADTQNGGGGNGGNGSNGGGGGSTSTTTNNTTTNNSTSTTTTNNDSSTNPPRSTILSDLYDDVTNGLSKATLLSLAQGVTPSCTSTQLPVLGTQEVCTFTEDGHAVIVTLLNNSTVSKVKVGF